MKRVTMWVLGAGVASVALMIALRAQEQSAKPIAGGQASSGAAPAAPAASGEEKVAFTFTDEEQMKQFAQVWQQRQAALTRMAVLQAYWNQEQGGLTQMNQQLLSQFNLDVSKNYTLDTDKKVLVEQPLTPEQAAVQSGAATPGSPEQPARSMTPPPAVEAPKP